MKPNGSKLWERHYASGGKQKTMAFGIHPMVGLVDARAKRDDARARLDEGRDPSVVKKLRIEANIEASRLTFERVAREWHEICRPQWAAVHADDVLRSLSETFFLIVAADLALTPPQIYEVLEAIENRTSIEPRSALQAHPGGLLLRDREGHGIGGPCRKAWSRIEAA